MVVNFGFIYFQSKYIFTLLEGDSEEVMKALANEAQPLVPLFRMLKLP